MNSVEGNCRVCDSLDSQITSCGIICSVMNAGERAAAIAFFFFFKSVIWEKAENVGREDQLLKLCPVAGQGALCMN